MKLKKEKIRELIRDELSKYHSKKITQENLYKAIHCYLENSYTLSKKDFKEYISKFKTDVKKGEYRISF